MIGLLKGIFLSAVSLAVLAKKKCLLVNIDNRDLSKNINDNSYAAKTAVLNLDYAQHHGYDFVYVQNVVTDLEMETRKKFPSADIVPPTDNAKDAATAFHVGLKQFRAASWAKLPALWHVTTTIGKDYEYIWYIDSDATVSPLHRDKSIEDQIKHWEEKGSFIKGRSDISKSAFIFFHNHPWRDDMPCAGSFIYRPELAEPILREWWDFDLPIKNFKHFHEQDALWHMIEAESDPAWIASHPDVKFRMNTHTYTILREQQFPSAWKRYEELWLCHIASYNYALRTPILFQFLKVLGLEMPHRFAAKVEEITDKHTMKIKLLDVTIKMEQKSQLDEHRIIVFPAHDVNTELAWYDAHVTAKTEPVLAPAVLHEGRLIRKKGEFWLVHLGSRRGFENYDTFLNMGFFNELGISLYQNEVESIPIGPTLTAADVANAATLAPHYQAVASKTTTTSNSIHVAVSQISDEALKERLERRMRHHNATINAGRHGKCEVNETLEALVRTPGTRCMLYLIAHDADSEHLARKFSSCKESWIQPVRINSTVFFESIIYKDIFPVYQKEWEDLDYVVTATYKTVAKHLHYNKYTQSLDLIQDSLRIARDGDFDVVPFLRSGSGTMSFCLYFHGKPFRAAWDALLLELGYPLPVIRSHDEMKSFYRNIYVIKPKALKELTIFMYRAMDIAQNNPAVKALLEVDSRYKEGTEEVALRIFGTTYYKLYPFIFERLPSFFLHASNAKICAATAGPCPYNS